MQHSESNTPATGVTLHLTPEDVWGAFRGRTHYQPEAFAADGFIHCTDDAALLLEVGNRYYRDDLRSFLVLDVDLARVQAQAIYEDEQRQYPHIYGPLEREAVVRVRRAERAEDGSFTGIGPEMEIVTR